MKPRVSIVVAAHEGAEFLAQCIESCMVQTMPDFELLIVGNGNEAAREIAERYRELDSRVRAVRDASESRCAAIANQRAIDLALPDRLERQLDWLHRHPEAAMVTGRAIAIRADGKPFLGYRSATPDVAGTAMFRRGLDGTSHRLGEAVIRRRVLPDGESEPSIPRIFDLSAAGYHESAARMARSMLEAGAARPRIASHLAGIIRASEALAGLHRTASGQTTLDRCALDSASPGQPESGPETPFRATTMSGRVSPSDGGR